SRGLARRMIKMAKDAGILARTLAFGTVVILAVSGFVYVLGPWQKSPVIWGLLVLGVPMAMVASAILQRWLFPARRAEFYESLTLALKWMTPILAGLLILSLVRGMWKDALIAAIVLTTTATTLARKPPNA
ncbi:MAG: hypothetical protein ACRDIU_05040, partial [Actinomycetota bacterium]